MAPDFSHGEMFNNRSFPRIAHFGPPDLLADRGIVALGTVWVQYNYNSTQCARELGPWFYVRIFRVNAEMASAR